MAEFGLVSASLAYAVITPPDNSVATAVSTPNDVTIPFFLVDGVINSSYMDHRWPLVAKARSLASNFLSVGMRVVRWT